MILAILFVACVQISVIKILVNHIPLIIWVGDNELRVLLLRAVVLNTQRCRAIGCVEVLVEVLLTSEMLGFCFSEHLSGRLALIDI